MAFPKKYRRKITVEDQIFYWSVRNKANHNERHNDPYLVPIQHHQGGQLLLANIGYCRSGYTNDSIPVITPDMVERIIQDAIFRGWDYFSSSKPPLTLEFHELIKDADPRWTP